MITVLYSGYVYLNASRPLLLEALARVASDRLAVVDVTRTDLDDIRRRLATSDAIVLDQSLINAAYWTDAQLDVAPSVYYMMARRPKEHYLEAVSLALDASAVRVFFSYSDIHDPKDIAVFERLAPRVDALFWAYFKTPIDVAAVPVQYRDPFMTAHADPIARFDEVRRQFPLRVDIWHALGASEIDRRGSRPLWDVCIPGANYRTRIIARDAVATERLSRTPFRAASLMIRQSFGRLANLLPSQRTAEASVRSEQAMQRTLVRHSRTTFVCGSGLNYAVRKFAEVPALRSAMIAYPCIGFSDLGFQDGVNAIVCAPEDAGRVAKRLIADDSTRQRLVNAAWDVVHRLHTVERRAAEVLDCIDRLLAGTLHHAEFVDGRFVVE